ncbi:pyridoxal phosphate-dependent aminotransferase [Cytophagales bacterium RKSG123]|nr:pyridoxal phosphate-dependent aminotransferase [Xanthovirga aplysinae]MTI32000.1 pyridoxal phosphate-dependent aminotransferase [Xanthovirga aplysinae]
METPLFNINPNLKKLGVSATLQINEVSNELISNGKKIYKFGLGESPFPVPDIVVEELKANAHQKSYLPVSGLFDLQDSITKYLFRSRKMEFSPKQILIGPGSKELLFILQQSYNTDLLLPSPSWVSYAPQAHIGNQRVFWLKTEASNKWKLSPEVLDAHCKGNQGRPQLLILNYPNNPHGYTYSGEELKALAAIAAEHQLLVLSDEIYGELNHAGDHETIASYYPQGTIISDGLSKWCGAGGWRLGFLAFPEGLSWLKKAMATFASETYTSVSAPIQYAAIQAFKGGAEIDNYLFQARKILKSLGGYITEKLRGLGCNIENPDGGFYLFPDFSGFSEQLNQIGISTSDDLCERILQETGVAMLPGSAFGRPREEYTMRLSYVNFNGGDALKAAEQIPLEAPIDTAFLQSYCSNCIEGINRLSDWLKNNTVLYK